MKPHGSVLSARVTHAIAALLILIAVLRVAATYQVFSLTYDEPYHIGAGMEWLDKGQYRYETQHPPLSRIAAAMGPYLAGLRSQSKGNAQDEGIAILTSRGNFQHNVTLARMGNLLFLVWAAAVVYLWATRWFSPGAALVALILFTSLPPILGHAGLATTDMAVAATTAGALYQFLRWLEKPGASRAVRFGLAAGTALLSKFSSLLFLPVCFAIAVTYLLLARPDVLRERGWTLYANHILLATAACLALTWAVYRFSLEPVARAHGYQIVDSSLKGNPRLRAAAQGASEVPVPLSEVIRGIGAIWLHNREGHASFFGGEFGTHGWWLFFPVVLAIKTPIAFLLLSLAGLAVILGLPSGSWQRSLTALFPLAILLVCLPSRINLGVRHVLPIYPMLAVAGGYVVTWIVQKRRVWTVPVAVALMAWATLAPIYAHPDYLAYFNEVAGKHPENIDCESDLDWGQDAYRLADRLRVLGAPKVALKYFGTMPINLAGLPPIESLSATVPATGYAAISVCTFQVEYMSSGAFGWLRRYKPLERVGKSILLYYIPANDTPGRER